MATFDISLRQPSGFTVPLLDITSDRIKSYQGAVWPPADTKYWTGTGWKFVKVKVWDGSNWIE